MTRGRAVVAGCGAALMLLAAGCGNGPPSSSGGGGGGEVPGKGGTALGAATVTVMGNDQDKFSPDSGTLKVGDIIQWSNGGSHVHNVTFDDYQPLTGNLGPGDKWEVQFTKAGSYDYHCTFHPAMTAKLTVS